MCVKFGLWAVSDTLEAVIHLSNYRNKYRSINYHRAQPSLLTYCGSPRSTGASSTVSLSICSIAGNLFLPACVHQPKWISSMLKIRVAGLATRSCRWNDLLPNLLSAPLIVSILAIPAWKQTDFHRIIMTCSLSALFIFVVFCYPLASKYPFNRV